jgi:hypothetical protein
MKYKLLSVTLNLLVMLAAFGERPPQSQIPWDAMQKLNPLLGEWEIISEFTPDAGKTWQAMPKKTIAVSLEHKDLVLSEIPTGGAPGGFEMMNFITYDQYRKVYRKAAMDDTWGIMDLYEGNFEGSELVVTNLKSGTFFPMPEGKWRAFKLRIELGDGNTRVTHIDHSEDGGATWVPSFKVSHTKID